VSRPIETYTSPLAVKTFLYRMFHPHGFQASRLAGLVPASSEVSEAEFASICMERENLSEEQIGHVLVRAQQAVSIFHNRAHELMREGIDGSTGGPQGDIQSLSLVEILVGFYLAMDIESKQLETRRGQLVL